MSKREDKDSEDKDSQDSRTLVDKLSDELVHKENEAPPPDEVVEKDNKENKAPWPENPVNPVAKKPSAETQKVSPYINLQHIIQL